MPFGRKNIKREQGKTENLKVVRRKMKDNRKIEVERG
jgi:hypothetical protein